VVAGGFVFVHQGAHQLAFQVVNQHLDGGRFLEAEADGGLGIEGIGIVAFKLRNRRRFRVVISDVLAGSAERYRQRGSVGVIRADGHHTQIFLGCHGQEADLQGQGRLGGNHNIHHAGGSSFLSADHKVLRSYDGSDQHRVSGVVDGVGLEGCGADVDHAEVQGIAVHPDIGGAGGAAHGGEDDLINPGAIISGGDHGVFHIFPFEDIHAGLDRIGLLAPDIVGARPLAFHDAIDVEFEEVIAGFAGDLFPETDGSRRHAFHSYAHGGGLVVADDGAAGRVGVVEADSLIDSPVASGEGPGQGAEIHDEALGQDADIDVVSLRRAILSAEGDGGDANRCAGG